MDELGIDPELSERLKLKLHHGFTGRLIIDEFPRSKLDSAKANKDPRYWVALAALGLAGDELKSCLDAIEPLQREGRSDQPVATSVGLAKQSDDVTLRQENAAKPLFPQLGRQFKGVLESYGLKISAHDAVGLPCLFHLACVASRTDDSYQAAIKRISGYTAANTEKSEDLAVGFLSGTTNEAGDQVACTYEIFTLAGYAAAELASTAQDADVRTELDRLQSLFYALAQKANSVGSTHELLRPA